MKFPNLEDFLPSLPNSEQPNILEPILFDWVNDYATVCSDYFHLLVQGKVHLRSWTMDLDLVQYNTHSLSRLSVILYSVSLLHNEIFM